MTLGVGCSALGFSGIVLELGFQRPSDYPLSHLHGLSLENFLSCPLLSSPLLSVEFLWKILRQCQFFNKKKSDIKIFHAKPVNVNTVSYFLIVL